MSLTFSDDLNETQSASFNDASKWDVTASPFYVYGLNYTSEWQVAQQRARLGNVYCQIIRYSYGRGCVS